MPTNKDLEELHDYLSGGYPLPALTAPQADLLLETVDELMLVRQNAHLLRTTYEDEQALESITTNPRFRKGILSTLHFLWGEEGESDEP